MFEWLKPKIRRYKSPEDQFLDSLQKPMTASQKAEASYHEEIHRLRDDADAVLSTKVSDDDFI